MSASNNTFRDFSFDMSDETRREEADFHISKHFEFLWNSSEPHIIRPGGAATTGSETNVYGYNPDSRRDKNEEKVYRNQMIDLPELLVYQDMDANAPRVEHVPLSEYIGNNVESHADSDAIGNLCDIVEDAEKKYKLTTCCNRKKKNGDLIKRYCTKCKIIIVDAMVTRKVLCAKCKTPLSYQCARCDKLYSKYGSLLDHLYRKCNMQYLNLKCPVCDYSTHTKYTMSKHLGRCLSGISFSCGFCLYTSKIKENLLIHMTSVHKDILKIDCSQCKTNQKKCKQCKNMVAICESCHTGLSSTDKFQEHQKSCKRPVLECKYCPYKTNANKDLKMHTKLEHLSALMSQDLPIQG